LLLEVVSATFFVHREREKAEVPNSLILISKMEHDGVDDDGGNDVCSSVVRRFRNSKAPEHAHLCAIALAVSEILQEQKLPASPTACFAAGMSSLEKQMNTTPRDLAVTTALCTFLSMVLPKVPPQVLRSKSDKTLQLLVNVLSSDNSQAGTVKTALVCVENSLKVADKSIWLPLARAFGLVLKHCVDQRPKVCTFKWSYPFSISKFERWSRWSFLKKFTHMGFCLSKIFT
jgi:hypothetical protein